MIDHNFKESLRARDNSTMSDDNIIEYWAVFTEANDTVMANEYHSEWQARKFKQVTEKMMAERGITGGKVWIEHGHYDSSAFPDFRQDMNNWGQDPAYIHGVQIK